MCGRVADRAVQIFGGAGYMRRLRHRALLPRRAPVPPLRRHQPDPADRHRPQHGARSERAEPPHSFTHPLHRRQDHEDIRIRRAASGRRAGRAARACGTACAQAAPYPSQPIKFIVPYPAGGATDTLARTVAQKLQRGLGPARAGGEQDRRFRHHRQQLRGQGDPRRLHRAGGHHRADPAAVVDGQAALRPAEGLRAGDADRAQPQHVRGAAGLAGQEPEGVRRDGQGQPGQVQLSAPMARAPRRTSRARC